jgi:hypothetical protein
MERHGFKIGLFIAGAVLGGILAIVLKHVGVLGDDFNGQWIGVIVAFGGLILGNYIDNNRDAARLARELEQERIHSESKQK